MGLRSALLVAAAGTSDAVRFAVGRAPQVRMGTAATDMGLPCKDECAVGKYPKMPPSVQTTSRTTRNHASRRPSGPAAAVAVQAVPLQS